MRRLALIAMLSVVAAYGGASAQTGSAAAPPPERIELVSEYRYDAVDYEERSGYFFRQKAAVFFSRGSVLHAAAVWRNDREQRVTYCLALDDIAPSLAVLAGHFYTHFGTGLLIGFREPYNPDLFYVRRLVNPDKNFRGCTSGNPVFALHGIAATVCRQWEDVRIAIKSFYSINRRFVDTDSYERGAIPAGLGTVESHAEPQGDTIEPVEKRNQGSLASINLAGHLLVQVHYLYSALSAYSHGAIAWDYRDSYGERYAVADVLGYGGYARYSDGCLSLFAECDFTRRRIIREESRREDATGRGAIGGMRFDHQFAHFSLVMKNTDEHYYAPDQRTVGSAGPERSWVMDLLLRPITTASLGASLAAHRGLIARYRNEEPPASRVERIYGECSYGGIKKFSVSVRRFVRLDDRSLDRFQYRSRMEYDFGTGLGAYAAATAQTGEAVQNSWTGVGGFSLSLGHRFKATASLGRASIGAGNGVYTIITPVRDTSIAGFFINESCYIAAARLSAGCGPVFFSGRLVYRFEGSRRIERRYEVFGSGSF